MRQPKIWEGSETLFPEDHLSKSDARLIALARFQDELVRRAANRQEAKDPILQFQRYCGVPDNEGWGPPPPAAAEA